MNNEAVNCLASLALFRELYNNEKDIYSVLSEFLVDAIASSKKMQFSLTEMKQILNETYEFNIPEAVVSTALKRIPFIEKSHGLYLVNAADQKNELRINDMHLEIKRRNELIVNMLYSFISDQSNRELAEDEKNSILQSFLSYMLDETISCNYQKYFSAFIIKNSLDENFSKILARIKEGIVLYSGLKYEVNVSDLGSWKSDLTIYLDTEIIFSLAGYNGELYNVLFFDFYNLVKEINLVADRKKRAPYIKLKYFNEVKDEIIKYFLKAESIITGNEKLNPSRTAMSLILEGCKSPSDIIAKKVALFGLLAKMNIFIDDEENYYDVENHKYSIESQVTVSDLKKDLEINDDDLADILKSLNYISIRRKGNNAGVFENIGYIFLTGKSNTLSISWNHNLKNDREIPLATTLSFLTNKIWFKLNKGFGHSTSPKSFDVITKALIVLSGHLNTSVSTKYDELKMKFSKGEITEENAKYTIVELRKLAKKPEEIQQNDVADILSTISESSIESFVQEHEHVKNKAKKQETEVLKLRKELDDKMLNAEKINKELAKYKKIEAKILTSFHYLKWVIKILIYILFFVGVIYLGYKISQGYNNTIGIVFSIIVGFISIFAFFKIDFFSILNHFKKIKIRYFD